MKQYFTILFSILTLFACETKTQDNHTDVSTDQSAAINILVDILNIPIKGDLVNAAWFRNNFYAMFETSRKNTSASFKKMIVFNKKGEVIEDVFLPKEIQDMVYCDLIVNNDSLYVKETQFEKANLVLGEYVADFSLTTTKDFQIFRDDSYNVYSVCNGEFGGTIYFQNKKTGRNYEAGSSCPIVLNKMENHYYVTNSTSILKIQDPKKLEISNLNFKMHQGSLFRKGIETLFDAVDFDMDFRIATSFVNDKKLLNLYSDKQGTYVGEIENKKMKLVYKFPFKFSANFNQQLDSGGQILVCYFADNSRGVLVIDGKNFNFYKLK